MPATWNLNCSTLRGFRAPFFFSFERNKEPRQNGTFLECPFNAPAEAPTSTTRQSPVPVPRGPRGGNETGKEQERGKYEYGFVKSKVECGESAVPFSGTLTSSQNPKIADCQPGDAVSGALPVKISHFTHHQTPRRGRISNSVECSPNPSFLLPPRSTDGPPTGLGWGWGWAAPLLVELAEGVAQIIPKERSEGRGGFQARGLDSAG